MNIDFDRLKMPGISREGQRIMSALSKEGTDINELAQLVSQDPASAAVVIKYANSPVYRRRFEITNVRHAVYLLGVKNVRLAVVVVTLRSFARPASQTKEILWEHAFGISTLAKMIADVACPRHSDDIVFSALMQDVGALVLATNFPDDYDELITRSLADGTPMDLLEREHFGIDHLELMKHLGPQLRVPQRTIDVITGSVHRAPIVTVHDDADYHQAVIALANLLEHEVFSHKGHFIKQVPDSREGLLLALGLSDDRVSDLLENFQAIVDEHYAEL